MIDTHTHLYYDEDYPEGGGRGAVERALSSGVSHMVMPNVGLDSMEPMLRLHHEFEDVTSVGAGLHPEEVDRDWLAKTEAVFDRFADERIVAVGEVGIDLYHDPTYRTQQMDCFGYQLDRARGLALPVIIHCRSGLDETLHVLKLMGMDCPGKLIFHSFTTGADDARRIMEAFPDAAFGINGVVTFKNAPELREAVALIGAERIVLETDSPYLSPVPKRGRVNESSHLGYIRDKVAEVCGLSPDELEAITDRNARRIFFTAS